MKGFIRLQKAGRALWLRPQDIVGVSDFPEGCRVYVRGQTEGFLVENSPKDVFERIDQAK